MYKQIILPFVLWFLAITAAYVVRRQYLDGLHKARPAQKIADRLVAILNMCWPQLPKFQNLVQSYEPTSAHLIAGTLAA